jgi:hypothetical protein
MAFAPCASSKVKDAILNILLIFFTIVCIIASLANLSIGNFIVFAPLAG